MLLNLKITPGSSDETQLSIPSLEKVCDDPWCDCPLDGVPPLAPVEDTVARRCPSRDALEPTALVDGDAEFELARASLRNFFAIESRPEVLLRVRDDADDTPLSLELLDYDKGGKWTIPYSEGLNGRRSPCSSACTP